MSYQARGGFGPPADRAFRPLELTSGCRAAVLIVALVVVFSSCLFPLPLFGAQQQVTLRFLDPKSCKPIRKMWVDITQYKGNPPKGPIPAEYVLSALSVQTDRNGEVAAILRDPLTTYISIHSFDLSHSGPLVQVDEVLKSGAVLDYSGKGAPQGYWVDNQGHRSMESGSLLNHNDKKSTATCKPEPEPGVVVFVEKRLTAWDKMRQETP